MSLWLFVLHLQYFAFIFAEFTCFLFRPKSPSGALGSYQAQRHPATSVFPSITFLLPPLPSSCLSPSPVPTLSGREPFVTDRLSAGVVCAGLEAAIPRPGRGLSHNINCHPQRRCLFLQRPNPHTSSCGVVGAPLAFQEEGPCELRGAGP